MYEIEIKSLLGSREKADEFKTKLSKGRNVVQKGKHSQLNHYFIVTPDDLSRMEEKVFPHVPEEKHKVLRKIITQGQDHSVRSREAGGIVLFVIKASIDEGTSSNTVSRMEFESKVDITIDELDTLLLDCGLEYQAKWSRKREEFEVGDMNITIDKNAGYGYLAEFEKVTDDESIVEDIKRDLLGAIKGFGLEELSQDRLERMFKYYNTHWKEYYGTDNVFTVE